MKRKLFALFAVWLSIGSLIASQALAKGTATPAIKYDFQEVKVLYAAEFTAYPAGYTPPKPAVTVTNSVYRSVYGTASSSVYDPLPSSGPKPLKVLYGVVSLSQAGQEGLTEQFIKVSDGTQSVRALSNGWSLLFDGSRPSGSKTEFVTGKKLEGNSVVKDYSGGWKAINLQRSWDVYQNLTDVTLAFTWDLTGGADPFFQQLAQTSYTVDINSWKHVGNQAAVN